MIIYLTFADQPSGIYSGQVIDTCKYISALVNKPVKLIAFISLRNFNASKGKIKNQYSNSIVLPMVPKLKNWRFNAIQLFFILLFKKSDLIICRNSIPTVLALRLKRLGLIKRVIYDGRGVEYEQIREYGVINDDALAEQILNCEKLSVGKSDYQIAVSSSLVHYWRQKFDYSADTFTVLPCTLNSIHEQTQIDSISRIQKGYGLQDIVIVYCGSVSGWQSFHLMYDFLIAQLQRNKGVKVLFLTKTTPEISALINSFPGRVDVRWCSENEVAAYLAICDYGLLLREDNLTNQVAAPVKFAEYLNAGLNVIISKAVGDFSEFVEKHACGYVYSGEYHELATVSREQKETNKQLAATWFSKNSEKIKNKFLNIISNAC